MALRTIGIPSLVAAAIVIAQMASVRDDGRPILNPDKPGVYLTLVRRGTGPGHLPSESRDRTWLRIHNNNKIPIQLYANAPITSVSAPEIRNGKRIDHFLDGVEVQACYDVEGMPDLTNRATEKGFELDIPIRAASPDPHRGVSCLWFRTASGLTLLNPGHAVVFHVPSEFVTAGRRISTRFAYEWERDESGHLRHKEPVHLVYFP